MVLVLIALAVVRYTGPTATVQGYVNDFFTTPNASDAYSRLCADAQAKTSVHILQTTINSLKSSQATFNLSGVTYTLVSNNFLNDAQVRLGGKLSVTIAGNTQLVPVANGTANAPIQLHSSGLGWCITSNNGSFTFGSSS